MLRMGVALILSIHGCHLVTAPKAARGLATASLRCRSRSRVASDGLRIVAVLSGRQERRMKRMGFYEGAFVSSALLTAFREWIKVQRLLSAAANVSICAATAAAE